MFSPEVSISSLSPCAISPVRFSRYCPGVSGVCVFVLRLFHVSVRCRWSFLAGFSLRSSPFSCGRFLFCVLLFLFYLPMFLLFRRCDGSWPAFPCCFSCSSRCVSSLIFSPAGSFSSPAPCVFWSMNFSNSCPNLSGICASILYLTLAISSSGWAFPGMFFSLRPSSLFFRVVTVLYLLGFMYFPLSSYHPWYFASPLPVARSSVAFSLVSICIFLAFCLYYHFCISPGSFFFVFTPVRAFRDFLGCPFVADSAAISVVILRHVVFLLTHLVLFLIRVVEYIRKCL